MLSILHRFFKSLSFFFYRDCYMSIRNVLRRIRTRSNVHYITLLYTIINNYIMMAITWNKDFATMMKNTPTRTFFMSVEIEMYIQFIHWCRSRATKKLHRLAFFFLITLFRSTYISFSLCITKIKQKRK